MPRPSSSSSSSAAASPSVWHSSDPGIPVLHFSLTMTHPDRGLGRRRAGVLRGDRPSRSSAGATSTMPTGRKPSPWSSVSGWRGASWTDGDAVGQLVRRRDDHSWLVVGVAMRRGRHLMEKGPEDLGFVDIVKAIEYREKAPLPPPPPTDEEPETVVCMS